MRREQVAELEERARRAERDAERERRLAAADERPGAPANSTTPPAMRSI
jgi:hypothetical protein